MIDSPEKIEKTVKNSANNKEKTLKNSANNNEKTLKNNANNNEKAEKTVKNSVNNNKKVGKEKEEKEESHSLSRKAKSWKLADRTQNTKTEDLPNLAELKIEALAAMNKDFCLAYVGSKTLLIHKYARRDDRPVLMTAAVPDGMLNYLKNCEYKSYKPTNGEDGERRLERKKLNIFNFWLESTKADRRRTVKFDPSTTEDDEDFNLWTGFKAASIKEKPDPDYIEIFLEYINNAVCPNEPKAAEYLLDWLAHIFQRPYSKIGVAVAVKSGRKGTGKSLLGDLMKGLIGKNAMRIDRSDQLVGRYSGHLSDKLFINAEESCFIGDRAVTNVLKSLITSTTQAIEPKFKDTHEVNSYLALYITSNNVHVIQASRDERRFLLIDNNESKYHQDTSFFSKVATTCQRTGKEHKGKQRALYEYLLNRDISNFNAIKDIPDTEAMREQKKLSFNALESWMDYVMSGGFYESVEDLRPHEYKTDRDKGKIWFKKNHMLERFNTYQKNGAVHPSKRMHITERNMPNHLKSIGLLNLHVREAQGSGNETIRGAKYWVIDML